MELAECLVGGTRTARDDNARLTKAEADAKLRKLMAQMIGGNR
jgi:hypothetical protein